MKRYNKSTTTIIFIIIVLFMISLISVLTYGIVQTVQERQNKIDELSAAAETSRQSANADTYLKYKLQSYQNMKEAYAYDEVVEDFRENILGKYEGNAYYEEIKEIYDYCKTHNAKTDLQNKQKDIETSKSIVTVNSVPDYTPPVQSSMPDQSSVNEKRTFNFILNTSTHTYHLYECSAAKKILPANRVEVTKSAYSLEEAKKQVEADGYKLCGRCD